MTMREDSTLVSRKGNLNFENVINVGNNGRTYMISPLFIYV
jgi:hypothetical protein